MKALIVVIKAIGYIWCSVALLLIVAGSIMVWVKHGFWEFMWLFSPFNIWNYLAVIGILLPGVLLFLLAEKLEKRKQS